MLLSDGNGLMVNIENSEIVATPTTEIVEVSPSDLGIATTQSVKGWYISGWFYVIFLVTIAFAIYYLWKKSKKN